MPELKKENEMKAVSSASAARNVSPGMEHGVPGGEKKKAKSSLGKGFLVNSADTPFSVVEAFKSLRTNILFALPDEGGKIIGVTSGEKGDGKSLVILNTAISFAELGKRCIIIDCDLRLPSIAAKVGVANVPGLTDVMVGTERPAEAIYPYMENLDILTAGTIPRDSTGIISSKRMKTFLSRLKEIYEYVFIDFPPVSTVTDAALLADSVDGYLLVTRNEKTEHKSVKEMLRLLKMANAHIIGFVYNDASLVAKKSYYKYYK